MFEENLFQGIKYNESSFEILYRNPVQSGVAS